MKFKKSITLISMGALNAIHGMFHIIQFIQSIIMVTSNHDWEFFDSPVFAVIWVILGFTSLWIGIKDFKHHRKCNSQ
jgi:hypothetical protein